MQEEVIGSREQPTSTANEADFTNGNGEAAMMEDS
jgi:hypothetical protein